MVSRTFRSPHPVDLGLTLGPLARGGASTLRFGLDGVWRATRTLRRARRRPASPHRRRHHRRITVEAWGPGAAWALDAAPALVGVGDDDDGFVAHHAVVADAHQRLPGLRIARSQAVLEALVPTILEQKVDRQGRPSGRGPP